MTFRIRITVMISIALVVAGSFTLVVNTIVLRNVRYPSVYSFNSSLLEELNISRPTVVEYIRQHPEDLFASRFDEQPLPDGRTVGDVGRAIQQRPLDEALASARRWSFVGLLVVLVGAVGAAWALAGGILRPIRKMTARARSASASDLGDRVAATGPNDEIKELADTFDAMLDRLAVAFDAQRRFASQVAHELRTPLATSRTEIAMLLDDTADPDVTARLRAVSDAVDRGERLVSRLLVLSRTDPQALETSRFALDELVGNVLGRVVEAPAFSRLRLDVDLHSADVECDRALLESLVRNLLDNSARHNRPDGWVRVSVGTAHGEQFTDPGIDAAAPALSTGTGTGGPDSAVVCLRIANSVAEPTQDTEPAQDAGPAQDAERTQAAEPALDGAGTPAALPAGEPAAVPGPAGTGLSIVNAVLQAHGGTITWSRGPGEVTALVRLPSAASARPSALAMAGQAASGELTPS
ncbi:hypothetical protein Ga0074812_109167 [Parafrankia irregularis]|uniref:histidine kinase n=1 Tax=Parafrankia irregularis TaxID=795642 RepID=A0A0S4QND0_9ACTN|nr:MULTISPECIES: histidine kinase dimerization/phospho-acceptor domain-containing protein [Parafrankia]MBE3200613.1 HAMP domain-containing protein [Parafrankia sp. CH37]CUU56947.1 hypothetical protein Ga0074812_109167 [Parafrankia irregularis]